MKTSKCFLLIALLGFGLAASVSAQATKEPLTVDFSVRKQVATEGGKAEWVAGQEAKPGDLLQYTAVYTNEGQGRLTGIKAVIPIPSEVTCMPETAQPTPTEASLDGVEFLPWEVVLAAVADAQNPVSIRSVRWSVSELPTGAKFEASVRAKVN